MIDKTELLEMLEDVYGDLDDDGGCYKDNGEWFSLKRIVKLINMCTVMEEDW